MSIKIHTLRETELRRLMRQRLELSQEQAAKKFGVSRVFYNLWENGRRTSKPLSRKLALHYGALHVRKHAA